jgi:hypothetical protein
MKNKYVFVYNADSGLFSALTDSAHKLFSPKTYKCNLCKLTYGLKNMKNEWADFIKSLPCPIEFIHRDELHESHPETKSIELPSVFLEEDGKYKEVITAKEINATKTVEELVELVAGKLG